MFSEISETALIVFKIKLNLLIAYIDLIIYTSFYWQISGFVCVSFVFFFYYVFLVQLLKLVYAQWPNYDQNQ